MRHTFHICSEQGCIVCEGKIGHCTVCDASMTELPLECPGRLMSAKEKVFVAEGDWNYLNGQWVECDGVDPETGKTIWVKHPYK